MSIHTLIIMQLQIVLVVYPVHNFKNFNILIIMKYHSSPYLKNNFLYNYVYRVDIIIYYTEYACRVDQVMGDFTAAFVVSPIKS